MNIPRQTDEHAQFALVGRPVEALKSSVLLKMAVAGALMIALAVALQLFVVDPVEPGLAGIWTGMLPVWGTALILTGLGGYGYVAVRRR